MRKPAYISPTALSLWLKEGPERYYLQYLADNRPPREPQTEPMSVGSSFDAYVKSYLHTQLFGSSHRNSNQFQFDAIFEVQVESQNRDFARKAGLHCFEQYRSAGALLDLLTDLKAASVEPRFEFDVCGTVTHKLGSAILLGKPDVFYVNKHGLRVILDWKVNGYCSKYPKSPSRGYVRLRSQGKMNHGPHKDACIFEHMGLTINGGLTLENIELDWARQLATYAWLLGEAVGGDFVVAVDQLACSPTPIGPNIRIAEHRSRIGEKFQHQLFDQYVHLWDVIESGYVFRQMTPEESATRCQLLEEQAANLYGENADPLFTEMTRRF